MRSDVVKKGATRCAHRSLFHANGYGSEDLGKPLIGVCNSFNEIIPGHFHLNTIAEAVKLGVAAAGGTPIEFPSIGVCDGIAMGHTGMKYSLASRELIADSIEAVAMASGFDGLVLIPNCDKVVPGMLMAALRLNIPAIFVSGGPMESGAPVDGVIEHRTDLIDAIALSADDELTDDQLGLVEESACPTCGSCSGMFTANSMNCLTEALGLSLPGNGSTLATARRRRDLFVEAGRRIVDLCKRYYERDDDSVLPRSIATRDAFLNAMSMDIAMGGSTNTILHTLAAAQEGEVDFNLRDIDDLSRKVPCLAKIAPNSYDWHIEDFHRAGGIPALLGELDRAGLLRRDVHAVHADDLEAWLGRWDVRGGNPCEEALDRFRAAPGRVRTTKPFSQDATWESLDTDSVSGCIRSVEEAYTKDGGLAVLFGNIAEDGAVVKTAGVDESLFHFEGRARVVESQEAGVELILSKAVEPGDIVVILYEGPKGGPGMQEMLYPTTFLKGLGLGKACGLITDGRFSGGTSGLSIGHISPEAAAGGAVGLIEEGDLIVIDIPSRTLKLDVSDDELARRRAAKGSLPWKPSARDRKVSKALQAYAAMATSADKGAVRRLP